MKIIYKLVDIESGKIYIGATCDLRRRVWEHNTHRHGARKAYGFVEFSTEILEEGVSEKAARFRENYWCEYYLLRGGNVVCKIRGHILNKEDRARYSELRTKEFNSGKSRLRVLNMSAAQKIKVIDQNGTLYESMSDCARKIGSCPRSVQNAINGKYKHTKGYILTRAP